MAVTLPGICQALATVLATVPGVRAAYGIAPNQLGATLPAIVILPDPELLSEITMGSSEVWKHRLLCRCYIAPAKNVEGEMGLALAYPEPMTAALRATNGLGLGVEFHGVNVLFYRIGVAAYSGVDHVIAELGIEARAKYATEIVR